MTLMMGYGMMYKQGDILLIPVPFTDLSTKKQRPVLVISNDYFNSTSQDFLVSAITSHLRNIDYSIIITSDDLKEGELKITSAVKADKIYTLSQNIVKKKFGHVNKKILIEVVDKVKELL